MNPSVSVIIPARMASSRYPGKPLAKILDLPMIEHVRRRAMLARGVDEVAVATCDRAIYEVVSAAGGLALMTSDVHERSTERVAEAMSQLTGEVVIVVQGDEPLVLPGDIEAVGAPFKEKQDITSVSLLSPLESDADFTNPNIVKAACDQQGYILFFSRAPIPHHQKPGPSPIYRETGIRAFRTNFLQTYISLPETPFERVESVDMLRVLEHGHEIYGVVTDQRTIGVDHPEDIEIVERILRADPAQAELYKRILQSKDNSGW
jgi:3-deoxy-manno-octulosonate cytidylyltransferase (CMP-KDO synthetase)